MDVVLVSARTADVHPHWSVGLCRSVAGELAAAGARVQWLCPTAVGEPAPPPVPGVEIAAVEGSVPSFRCVEARVGDTATDQQLARMLRPLRRAHVVHCGLGAAGSATPLWLAERMGARPIAVVTAREVLCARQTLVDCTGARCDRFDDPQRCTECTSAPWSQGLSPLQAKCARALRFLGGHSPFPNRIAMLSRSDLVLGSLMLADVLVADAVEKEQLVVAGVPLRSVQVVGPVGGEHPGARAVAQILSTMVGVTN